jgi:hypothetical protein
MATMTQPAVQIPDGQRMSVAELSRTLEFARLTMKQAAWVRHYVQNYLDTGIFDPTAATEAAYSVSSKENARTFSYQILANPKVALVLNRFRGVPTKLEQIANLLVTIDRSKDSPCARYDAQRLLAQLTGLLAPSPESSKPKADKTQPAPVASEPDSKSRVPDGATPLKDSDGIIKGYKTPNGSYVQLSDVEVSP